LSFLNGAGDLRFGFGDVFVFLEDERTLNHEKGIAVADAEGIGYAAGTFGERKKMNRVE
jgi:hypothetical protein